MATNAASSNPIGHKTGPVVDSVPAVSSEVKSAVRAAANERIAPGYRKPNDTGHTQGNEGVINEGGDGCHEPKIT
ncbi:hypothetical protein EDC01DRAFT_210983 [Geopyxis carbonaria]|nr:hypothetical protein EDC01DRAFT_210983 [Geopyxis carbonaria]